MEDIILKEHNYIGETKEVNKTLRKTNEKCKSEITYVIDVFYNELEWFSKMFA